jgi:hydrogenase/urease accessory protein HupE
MNVQIAIAALHAGHAGDHGWLAGAAQPLLSWDHFFAGAFVLFVGASAMAVLGRLTSETRADREQPPT